MKSHLSTVYVPIPAHDPNEAPPSYESVNKLTAQESESEGLDETNAMETDPLLKTEA